MYRTSYDVNQNHPGVSDPKDHKQAKEQHGIDDLESEGGQVKKNILAEEPGGGKMLSCIVISVFSFAGLKGKGPLCCKI